ncbi:MAG: hypothetical protein KUG77_03460 [Nannocystaceae bacterium]|nr:hypothetical protein [Nannocystaceae bacterium]
MKTFEFPTARLLIALACSSLVACDVPECIDGPSSLTPEAVAQCTAPPEGTEPESDIVSAGSQLREDGTLVITWSSRGLQCGVPALDVPFPDDCTATGWTLTAEIPPELAVEGLIELSEHPEVRGSSSVTSNQDGRASQSIEDAPFFVGAIELSNVADGCITGVLHALAPANPTPSWADQSSTGRSLRPAAIEPTPAPHRPLGSTSDPSRPRRLGSQGTPPVIRTPWD